MVQSEFAPDELDWQLLALLQTQAELSNQDMAHRLGVAPATTLRRVQRLRQAGWIERQVAVLNADAIHQHTGHGLSAVVEVSLDRQDAASLDAFEARAVACPEVQQCYRTSPGPDFVLIVTVAHMPAYQALSQQLFNTDASVRNVKAFFSIKRAKFTTQLPLPVAPR